MHDSSRGSQTRSTAPKKRRNKQFRTNLHARARHDFTGNKSMQKSNSSGVYAGCFAPEDLATRIAFCIFQDPVKSYLETPSIQNL